MIFSNFSNIVAFVGAHKAAALTLIFASMIFEGESFLIAAGVLIHIGALSAWEVISISLIGVLVGDFFWYFLGVYLRKVKRAEPIISKFESIVQKLLPFFKEKPFISLVLAKYIYGTNHATLILSGVIGMDLWLFAKAEAVATVVWVAIYLTLGYLFGSAALLVTSKVSIFLLIILILVVSLIALQKWISFYYEKKGGIDIK